MADDGIEAAWLVDGLHYAYPDGTEALRGLSFSVKQGEKVAVVGPNGAGKSTLFLCALGIVEGWSGRIAFDGVEASRATYDEIRRRVGLVFQEPDDMLFMPTVADDTAFGPLNAGLPHEEVERRVEETLRRVGMWDRRSRPAHHLSSGEKRRAALAAVLSMGADTLLLDEPTSGLDPKARRGFMALASELPVTMVIATHDLAMAAEVTQRVLVMHEGRIAASGSTEEVLFDEELMEAHGLEVPCLPRK